MKSKSVEGKIDYKKNEIPLLSNGQELSILT